MYKLTDPDCAKHIVEHIIADTYGLSFMMGLWEADSDTTDWPPARTGNRSSIFIIQSILREANQRQDLMIQELYNVITYRLCILSYLRGWSIDLNNRINTFGLPEGCHSFKELQDFKYTKHNEQEVLGRLIDYILEVQMPNILDTMPDTGEL